jgi:hypothetical protein
MPSPGSDRLPGAFRRFRGLLAARRRLGAKLLGESFNTTLCIDQLLPTGEERMAIRADFKVQLVLRGSRLPGRAARAANLNIMVLGVNAFPHSELLTITGKRTLYLQRSPSGLPPAAVAAPRAAASPDSF